MTEEKLCGGKTFKEVMEEVNFHIFDKHKIEQLQKENAKLKAQISVLLSCKKCPENKGGYICEKEYNDKCLAQKIEYIKELTEENEEFSNSILELSNSVIELTNSITELENKVTELEKEIDYYKSRECHWDEIEEDAKIIAEENAELKSQIGLVESVSDANADLVQRLMCCGNCKHNSKTKMYKNPCRQCFELSCWELAE